jgi:hypothetical protein
VTLTAAMGETREQAEAIGAYLMRTLVGAGVSPAASNALAEQLIPVVTDLLQDEPLPSEASSSEAGGVDVARLLSPVGDWAIRHEDLKLTPTLIAVAAASAGYVDPHPTTAVGTGIAASILELGARLWRKRGRLNALQRLILAALKARQSEGFRISELSERLNAHAPDGREWTAAELTAELQSLTMMRLRDGSVVEFVKESDGRWLAQV